MVQDKHRVTTYVSKEVYEVLEKERETYSMASFLNHLLHCYVAGIRNVEENQNSGKVGV